MIPAAPVAAAALLLASLTFRASPPYVAGLAISAAGAAGVAAGAAARRRSPAKTLVDHRRGLTGPWQSRGHLARDPEPAGESSIVELQIREVLVDGSWHSVPFRVRTTVAEPPAGREWLAGDRFEAFLRLRPDRPPANPGVERRYRLRASGADLRASLKSFRQLRPRGRAPALSPGRWAALGRDRIRAAIVATFPRQPHVVRALLLGERAELNGQLTAALARAGLVHLLAISGLHVGMVLGAAYAAGRGLGLPRPYAALLAALALAVLLAVVVPRAPVRRAGWMAAAGLAGTVSGRGVQPLHSMALAAAWLCLVDPWVARDVGFQLSTVATAGILLLGPRVANALRSPLRPLSGLVAASAAAQVSVAPLIAGLTHRVPLAGLLLNLAGVPLLFVILMLAVAAVALTLVGAVDAAGDLARLAELGIGGLEALTRWAGDWGKASLTVSSDRVIWIGVFSVAVLLLAIRPRRSPAVPCLLAAGGSLVLATRPLEPPRELRLVALDVGQGEALVVQTPGSEALLIDAPGPVGSFDPGAGIVAPVLRGLGIRHLDAAGATHLHADHAGGLPGLIADLPVREIWLGSHPPDAPEARRLLAASGNVPVLSLAGGHRRERHGCRLEVLHPQGGWLVAGGTPVSNDASLVLRVECRHRSILLTGDVEAAAEADWATGVTPIAIHATEAAPGGWPGAHRRSPIRSSVLKVPHHGSSTSSLDATIDAVAPRVAVISAGWRNRFGFPKSAVLERYRRRSIAVYRTDRDGAITVTLGRRITARGERWTSGRGGH